MSDFSSISLPGKTAAQNSLGRGGQLIQIISVPKQLSNVAKAIRLAGEITHLGKNGIIRINTPEGEIEAQVKNTKQLQAGQKLEVEVPAGRPPRQATLRNPTNQGNNAPTPQPSNVTPRTPSQTQQSTAAPRDNFVRPETNFLRPELSGPTTPSNTASTSTARPQTTPVNVQQAIPQEILTQTTSTVQQQARPLTVEAVVRLLSVPPAQAQTIATEFIQNLNIQPATLARVPFTANLIAQNIQSQQSQSLLQIQTPTVLQNAPAPLTTQLVQNLQTAQQPVLNNNFLQIATPPSAITIQPVPQTQTTTPQTITPQIINAPQVVPQTQLLPPTHVQNLIPTTAAQTATTQQATTPIPATLTPVTFDPTVPANIITSQIQRVDIQITRIIPPEVLLTPPTTTQTAQASTTPANNIIPAATKFTPPLTGINTATTITAQVTGFTQQGLPLVTVHWPGRAVPQSFVMQLNSNNLQLGTQLQITPKAPVLTPIARQANPLLQGFQWPALDDLYNSLLQISPQAAASLTRTLPTPASPAQIGPAAMMFVAAVRSGDISAWLGDRKMDLIQRAGKENILSRLTQDTSSATRTTEPASAGEWRAVPLPMFWEGEIQKVTLYTRHENQQQQQDNEKGGKTRFIFDLTLSRMGEVQLDGLLQDNRLDLVVRTQNAFSAPMQQTMRQAYISALDSTDLSGELNFQGSTKNWVHVLEQQEQLGVHV